VEIYFTDSVNDSCALYVFLTEDSLIAEQYNGGVNYVHNHVFREALCLQWGDTLCSQVNKGTLITRNFVFDNSGSQYAMHHAQVAAYVRNSANEEIITGSRVAVSNLVVTASTNTPQHNTLVLFPDPSDGRFFIIPQGEHDMTSITKVKIFTATGILCYAADMAVGEGQLLDFSFLRQGLYLVYFETTKDFFAAKLIIDH